MSTDPTPRRTLLTINEVAKLLHGLPKMAGLQRAVDAFRAANGASDE